MLKMLLIKMINDYTNYCIKNLTIYFIKHIKCRIDSLNLLEKDLNNYKRFWY